MLVDALVLVMGGVGYGVMVLWLLVMVRERQLAAYDTTTKKSALTRAQRRMHNDQCDFVQSPKEN